jgi:hypothetical protein
MQKPSSPDDLGQQTPEFLLAIQANHPQSLMAVTLSDASCSQPTRCWILPFDPSRAAQIGRWIAFGDPSQSFCLDLTSAHTAAAHAATMAWGKGDVIFDYECESDSKANRERLFELTGAGLALSMGAQLPADALADLSSFLEAIAPLGRSEHDARARLETDLESGLRVSPALVRSCFQKQALGLASVAAPRKARPHL